MGDYLLFITVALCGISVGFSIILGVILLETKLNKQKWETRAFEALKHYRVECEKNDNCIYIP